MDDLPMSTAAVMEKMHREESQCRPWRTRREALRQEASSLAMSWKSQKGAKESRKAQGFYHARVCGGSDEKPQPHPRRGQRAASGSGGVLALRPETGVCMVVEVRGGRCRSNAVGLIQVAAVHTPLTPREGKCKPRAAGHAMIEVACQGLHQRHETLAALLLGPS